MINLENVDTILLDMDGTLLDRRFDDHFWLNYVPKVWGEKNNVSFLEAQKMLTDMFRSQENTLNWTDLDYWSDRLSLDIPLLKIDVDHLIAIHRYVVEFLTFAKQHRKRLWLVTNAHSKTLSLKMKKTKLSPYFDGIVSAHDVRLPKEDDNFWERLQKFVKYDKERTMLAEDSEKNLETAERYGIKYLVFVSRSSSAIHPKPSEKFYSIDNFSELLPQSNRN